jgi:hypothetical protein
VRCWAQTVESKADEKEHGGARASRRNGRSNAHQRRSKARNEAREESCFAKKLGKADGPLFAVDLQTHHDALRCRLAHSCNRTHAQRASEQASRSTRPKRRSAAAKSRVEK